MPNARTRWCSWLSLAMASGLWPVGQVAWSADDTAPAAAPLGQQVAEPNRTEVSKRIAQLIDALGSDDFAAREKAAKGLWEIGDAALPALREAARSDDPEMARRARGVINSFAFGLRPDTPVVVIDLVNQYRQGDAEQKKAAVVSLANHDVAGARVLLKLSEDEKDAEVRSVVINALVSLARPVSAQLIAEGETATVGRILATTASQAEAPSRDYAAFLLTTGGLEAELGRLVGATEPKSPTDWLRISCLQRAKGDLAKAYESAILAGEPQLGELLLADAGKYAELAQLVEKRGVLEGAVEELGYATAYHRLAGDTAAAEKSAKRLIKYAEGRPDDHWNAAEALLLNGFASEAIDLLLADGDAAMALEFLAPRMEFERIEATYEKAKLEAGSDLPRTLSKVAAPLHFQGRSKEAAELLTQVAGGKYGAIDLDTRMELIESGPVVGIVPEVVDAWTAQALITARQPEDMLKIVHKARFINPERGLSWWRALRDHRSNRTPVEAISIARRLDRKILPAEEVAKLLEDTRAMAATLPAAERSERLQLVADTLSEDGKIDEAIAVVEQIVAKASSTITLARLGDLQAKAGRWDRALEAYSRAAESDRSEPGPVALKGLALTKLGKTEEGKKLIETAHRMPLGNESERHSLADLFNDHGMKADARREREICRLTGDGRSWAYTDSLRRLADLISREGDPLAAADMWERAFLSNYSRLISFVEPSANLTIPVLILRTRAIGHIRKGEIDQAKLEAAQCFSKNAGDADSQIAIIRELDKANHKADADAIYKRAFDLYDGIRLKNPASPAAGNLVAWICACTSRDLDHGLACAKRAIDAQPDNTAILDTLSEVYFARGEYDEALKVNEKCRKLDPNVQHHKKNFERFTAAKAGKKVEPDE